MKKRIVQFLPKNPPIPSAIDLSPFTKFISAHFAKVYIAYKTGERPVWESAGRFPKHAAFYTMPAPKNPLSQNRRRNRIMKKSMAQLFAKPPTHPLSSAIINPPLKVFMLHNM